MKQCARCRKSKSILDFTLRARSPDGYNAACKDCTRKGVRRHYYGNREYYLDRNAATKAKIIEAVRQAKDVPCKDCTHRFPYWVMQFDHIQNKEFTISEEMMSLSLKRVLLEVDKCEVVCANCHAQRTHVRACIDERCWCKIRPILSIGR